MYFCGGNSTMIMARRRTTSFVAVLWLLFVAEMGVEKCRGWAEEAVKDVKDNISEISENANLDEKAEALKKGASEVFDDAKDTAESWSNWAYDKISKGLGLNEEELKETAHDMVDRAGDAAIKTTQRINTAASDASNYASEKTGEAVKAASEKASDVKTKAKETIENGKDKAAEAYEAVKNEVEQKVAAGKEKASQAAGEIGARIREKTAEL